MMSAKTVKTGGSGSGSKDSRAAKQQSSQNNLRSDTTLPPGGNRYQVFMPPARYDLLFDTCAF